jgi:uncharacterized cupredoxin-like copper-binding protein
MELRNIKEISMRMIIGAVITGGILASAVPVFADPGHAHGTMSIGRPGKAQQVTRTIEVVMDDEMRFTPAKVDVKRGETVRFVVRNVGQMKHEFMLGTAKELKEHAAVMQKHPEMEHDDPNAVSVEPGQTGQVVWQFTRAGSFMFGCLMPGHYEAGMVGHLQVQQAKATAPTSVKTTK